MSLADALITIFIIVLIGTLLIGIYFMYSNIYKVENIYQELSAENSNASQMLLSDIRNAHIILASKEIDAITYTTDEDTVIINLPSIDQNQDIIDGSFDTIVYQRDPLDLSKLKSITSSAVGSSRPSGTKLVSNDVDLFILNYNNVSFDQSSKVEIIFGNARMNKNKKIQIISQVSASLRNK